MFLDAATQKNLELIRNVKGGTEGTLLTVLDETLTHGEGSEERTLKTPCGYR